MTRARRRRSSAPKNSAHSSTLVPTSNVASGKSSATTNEKIRIQRPPAGKHSSGSIPNSRQTQTRFLRGKRLLNLCQSPTLGGDRYALNEHVPFLFLPKQIPYRSRCEHQIRPIGRPLESRQRRDETGRPFPPTPRLRGTRGAPFCP